MFMRLSAILITIFSLLILVGCLQHISSGTNQYEDYYRNHFNLVAISDPADSELCKMGSCYCMVCHNGTNIFGPMTSLVGGYCYFDKECNATKFAEVNSGHGQYANLLMHHFMVGQGPTFGDFSTANTFCNNRLGMAVQWLLGTVDSPYSKPDASRSMCFLSKDVIPVYILYSGGVNINITATRDIAEILGTQGDDFFQGRLSDGPVGPVIVVTEMNFNTSQSAEVAEQVRAIDGACQNDRANNKIYCLIAVGPKINDYAALDAIMNEPDMKEKIDLVAYGVDGRFVRSCDGSKINLQVINFSSYSLYAYNKPTIIPYVLFDPGTNDSNNSCTWSEYAVVNAYSSFFPLGIQALQKRGVIGIAPYSFNTTGGEGIVNPLNCTNCAVGKTQERLRAWYGGCQLYTAYTRETGNTKPSGGTLLLFGNASGAVCNYNAQFDYLSAVKFADRDLLRQQANPIQASTPKYFSCDACIINNITNPTPFSFVGISTIMPTDAQCSSFPEIDQWASSRNLDPMFVRAIIYHESSFQPCAAAKVCKAGNGVNGQPLNSAAGCFDDDSSSADECYSNAFNEMYDPTGTCADHLVNALNTNQPQPDWRWCAFGIMQSLEPPYTFWSAAYTIDGQNGPYYPTIFQANSHGSLLLSQAKICNPVNFNPFNPADSVCIGTYKIQEKLKSAKIWMNANRGRLNWPATDNEKENVFAAYVAAHKYRGDWDANTRKSSVVHPRCAEPTSNGDCWAYGFSKSWHNNYTYCASDMGQADTEDCDGTVPRREFENGLPTKCNGYTDIIEYIRTCEVPWLKNNNDYGANVMAAYFAFTSRCSNSMCPDGKVLYHAMEWDAKIPSSGTPYIQDPVVATP